MQYLLRMRHPTFQRFLNLLFPAQCLRCYEMVEAHGTLCASCWSGVHFLSEPWCERCGRPFDYTLGKGAQCGSCIHEPPLFAQARSCFRYDAFSRPLVLPFKYGDQTYLAATYGQWLMKASDGLVEKCDAIVPVPLHRWRLLKRRYNQAAILSQALARHAGIKVEAQVLTRTRNTRPQAGLTRAQRRKNVQRAFAVPEAQKSWVRGKTLLLVDDVMTSGTTILHCTKALLDAGASNVYVLTLARRV
jgi:ComF family protein